MALRMNKREQLSVCVAGLLILATIFYHWGIVPFLEKREIMERQLALKKESLETLIQLKGEYARVLNKSRNLKSIYSGREKGFTLFAFLENLAVKSGVDKHIDYMKPSTSVDKDSKVEFSLVKMKLKGINLSQLTSYLYLVETSKNVVFVKRLAISRDGKKTDTISAVLDVETVNT
ncbi:hypothetical protein [Desulfobacter latus]|uniref:General secretion pathway protein GspM n=1 Tax=Desulfobacter latus TaxID=2292 RepID=A0A850TAL9_9BACT|nr:hypothetical protein [Desulfobacter latus]NWH05638.1 hypothetical protein [Desulfobacter latus]